MLKVADVVAREDTYEAGWLGGLLDGEGSLHAGPGLRITFAQNRGAVLDKALDLLTKRGIATTTTSPRRCQTVQVNGGMAHTLALLQRFRPERLIASLADRLGYLSLYGRSHRAVALVSKEFLGEQDVVAIETDCKTYIAEGLASHNCYLSNFWRAVQADPYEVARHADWPVNEADLHARHRWLVDRAGFRERMKTDPDFYDARIAGWWVWGICQWIGGGWCTNPEWRGRGSGGKSCDRGINTVGRTRPRGPDPETWEQRPSLDAMGIHKASLVHGRDRADGSPRRSRPVLDGDRGVHSDIQGFKRPSLGQGAKGVHRYGLTLPQRRPTIQKGGHGVHRLSRQIPDIAGDYGAAGRGVHASALAAPLTLPGEALVAWFTELQERLRRVRVCCGDWRRILGPSPTVHIGTTAVFLDPPYSAEAGRDGAIYGEENLTVAHDVREWAIEHGNNPKLRIALCGYEGEHAMPASWSMLAWKSQGGYGAQARSRGRDNRDRERLWFSPHCLPATQPTLFEDVKPRQLEEEPA